MLYKYLLELKSRILLLIISWIMTFFTCYKYKKILFFLLIKLNTKLYYLKSFYFISTNLTDVFAIYVQLSYFVSTHLIVCLLFYHFLVFISPGLFNSEYKIIKSLVFLGSFFCLFGFLILNNYILPYIWSFFLSFQNNNSSQSVNIFFEAQIIEYFKFYIKIHYLTLSISQIFVLILIVLNFIKNKIDFVSKTRKVVYFSFLIFATIITPPDIVSQIIIWTGFNLFYELIIIMILFKNAINSYI